MKMIGNSNSAEKYNIIKQLGLTFLKCQGIPEKKTIKIFFFCKHVWTQPTWIDPVLFISQIGVACKLTSWTDSFIWHMHSTNEII